MRKRLKSKIVSITPDIATVRRVKSKTERVGDRVVNVERIEESGLPPVPDKRRGVSSFWTGTGGRFSKRAFFFSLFAFMAVAYALACMSGAVAFDERFGAFLVICNAAFGLNYYKNERDKEQYQEPGDVGLPRGL